MQAARENTSVSRFLGSLLKERMRDEEEYNAAMESYVSVTRKLRPGLDDGTARQDVQALLAWKPVTVDKQVLEQAWQVEDRHGLSFWDALILAAAQVGSCRYLLTEDLQDQQRIGGIVVVNPFRSTPESLA